MLAAYASAAHRPARARRLAAIVSLGCACALSLRLAPALRDLPRLLGEPPAPALAFDAARRYPGAIYFPERSLVSLAAEGRAYHFDWTIYIRGVENRPVSAEYLHAFLPPALERIAIDRRGFPHVLHRLPRFRRQIHDPLLPGWVVLVVDDLQAPGSEPAPPAGVARSPGASLPATAPPALGGPAAIDAPRATIAGRERRYRLRVDARVTASRPHDRIDLDVVLKDEADRHLLTLAAQVVPYDDGLVTAEWPLLDGVAWAAARAVVLVRGGRQSSGAAWRVPAEVIRGRLSSS
jgi:hypothetical protein